MESTRSMQADTGVDPRELLDAVDAYLVRYGGDFVPELVSSASGSRLYTVDGRCILDFTSGQMCATLGHNHPAIVAAIEKAAGRSFTSLAACSRRRSSSWRGSWPGCCRPRCRRCCC
jgi:4-aminobutyrate aminotransferase-like enzyme